ncbi:uncharacterized protein LOC121055993 [Oryza brachyantha]|uniref:uncharacterized protein LOC121055993 n=1 Tax=Oryza brachyantha TaxID=4533 RepID=UPI001AD954B0|nr:uncharacterized protein LOC121055993 [Oryza brachyantha]
MSHFAAAMKSPLPVAAAAADGKSPLFCPKPRRPVAPLRCQHDAGASMDLLDLLLSKEESSFAAASSPQPPLFCGSPPRRASNPVVHDSRFGVDCPPMPAWPVVAAPLPMPAPVAVVHRPTPRPAAASPMPMSPRGGCARARFAFQPAAVRVEGFDCLDRGRGGRGHGITAMA